MSELLKQAYEETEEIKASNEYRFLAKMYMEIYKEKERLKSNIDNLLEENLKLSNQLWKLRKGKNEKSINNMDS